ncbi:TonB-dependent receptor domain-containing protein [Methylocystis heyeri]|uniref:TonB-dependent receptor n=1 Tax=Methylocystis heyeri TaxID=391905 RepID=A0A6B8KJQ3_9HYPH|nr:TonB-dependent receptor [Methylocystis heyeri]QGM46830.1 TonB-dependent receptor [Methylocystis heyeri]
MFRNHLLRGVSAGAVAVLCFSFAGSAAAQQALPTIDIGAGAPPEGNSAPAPQTRAVEPKPQPVSTWSPTLADGSPAFVKRFDLPNTVSSVTRQDIEDKVNIIDTEDALKYTPSLFLRKRNNGDSQAVLQTRTWGVNSSARSLVYADDLLLTALVGNDNTIGAPRWGLVSPEEIERIDYLYGPYAAEYSGNAMGGVVQITTRMPEKLEVTAKETTALQDFSLWGTANTFHTNVQSFTIGDKVNDFSWFVAANWNHTTTQPLTYVQAASGTFPSSPANLFGYPGAEFMTTKFGVPATALGTAGNLLADYVNAKIKLAYDVTPTVRATYTIGLYTNDSNSTPGNWLINGGGPWFGLNATPSPPWIGTSAMQSFGAAYYRFQEKILTNAGAVKSNTHGLFDWEVSASNFTYLQSDQVSPYSAAWPWGGYTQNGKDAVYTGTYWTLFDAKGIYRPFGEGGAHEASFGIHGDQYHLNNPTWLTSNWASGSSSSLGVVSSIGDGTTRTQAIWAQDAWKFYPNFKATLGLRGEHWEASDGYNQSLNSLSTTGLGSTAKSATLLPIYQPVLVHTRWSPKGSLQWTPDDVWTVTANVGMANRFPTAKELYNQTSLNGGALTANPNPYLRPEVALTKELVFERKVGPDGSVRLTLFDEEVRDAIISQNLYVAAGSTVNFASSNVNVNRIRNSGTELAWKKDNVFYRGLELSGSFTYVNSRVISDSLWAPSGGNNLDNWALSVAGKNVPYVPKFRWEQSATYRPDDHWAFTVSARWQDRMWSTLSNNDTAHGVYGSFDRFFQVDTKIHYKYNDRLSFDFGIDNLNNYKYFLFHPFPQRTFVFSGKYEFGTGGKNEPGIFYTGNEEWLPAQSSWFQPADTKWF